MSKMDKAGVIQVLEKIAMLLEYHEANFFKVRAFQNAAAVLASSPADLQTLLHDDNLEKLKGIGKGHIAEIIRELDKTGTSKDLAELEKGIPKTLFELLDIPG